MFKIIKKFVSLREAAKLSGYSSDYIGWLIREGKIRGKRAHGSLSWQVSLPEIKRYWQKKKRPEGGFDAQGSFFSGKKDLSLKEAARLLGYAPDYVGYLIRAGEIRGKKIYGSSVWLVDAESLLNYRQRRELKRAKIVDSVYAFFPSAQKKISYWFNVLQIFLQTSKYVTPLVIFCVIICGAFFVSAFPFEEFETATVKIYPTASNGGWENPQNSRGKPQLSGEAAIEDFNEENSSVLENSASQIVYSDFKGKIPLSSKIKKVSLKISWTFKKEERAVIDLAPAVAPQDEPAIVPESESEKVPEEESITNSEEVPEDETTSPEETSEEAPEETPSEAAEEGPEQVPEAIPEAPPEINPEPSPGSGDTQESSPPTSFWKKIINSVFAKEEDAEKKEKESAPETDKKDHEEQVNETPVPEEPESEENTDKREPAEAEPDAKEPIVEDPATEDSAAGGSTTEEAPVESSTVESPAIEGASSGEPVSENGKKDSDVISDPFLEILYAFPAEEAENMEFSSNTDWQSLGKVSQDNWKDLVFEIPISNREDLRNIQIQIKSLPTFNNQPIIYLDGLWLEVEYQKLSEIPEEEIAKLPRIELGEEVFFNAEKKDFRINEEPQFEINVPSLKKEYLKIEEQESEVGEWKFFPEPAPEPAPQDIENGSSSPASFIDGLYSLFSAKKVFAEATKIKILDSRVFNFRGEEIIVLPVIEEDNGKTTVRVPAPAESFRPGKYTIRTEALIGEKVFVSSQDFTWGVLAINTNKSVYLSGETAYLQMAVLTDAGKTICNSNLELEITSPGAETETLTTEKGDIRYSDTCGANNVTDNPDYFAFYRVSQEGEYKMKLINLDNGYEIEDSFEARRYAAFDVERVGATRINPFRASYVMTLKIRANQNFKGQVTEQVPAGFEIISPQSAGREIIWQVDLEKGEEIELKYEYQSPKISPELYFLGPLKFSEDQNWVGELIGLNDKIIFQEARRWQLASDSITMWLFWEQATSPALGWSVDTTYDTKFPRGDTVANFGLTGGVGTSTPHTATGTVMMLMEITEQYEWQDRGTSYPADIAHNHTATVTVGAASSSEVIRYENLPKYRSLKLIEYSEVATTTPTGAIALFTSSPSGNWSTDTSQDTRMVRIDSAITNGGSDLHYHNLTWSALSAAISASTTVDNSVLTSASQDHIHIAPTAASTTETVARPPFADIIFASSTADQAISTGMIALFDGDPGAGWTLLSDTHGDLEGKFLSGSSSYLTGLGSATHTHDDVISTSGLPFGTTAGTSTVGLAVADSSHTHNLLTRFDENSDHYPPYTNFVIAQKTAETIVVGGTTDLNDETEIRLAVNGVYAASTTAMGGIWLIEGVSKPQIDDVLTVWADGVDDAFESTAVTTYGTSGDVNGMILNANILSIGGAALSQSTSITNLSQYTCLNDEDVMHGVALSVLSVQGCANSYSDETLNILATNTLTVSGTETVTTDNLTIDGTVTSGGASTFNVSGNWTNNSVFTASTSTVNFNAGSGTQRVDSSIAATYSFYSVNHSAAGTLQLSSAIDVNGNFSNASGTFDCNSQNQNFAGNFSLSSGVTYTSGGTLTFDGTTIFTDDTSGDGQGLGTVTIGPTTVGSSVTTSTKIKVTGMTIGADDTLDISDDTLTLTGIGESLSVGGTFTVSGSTVIFNGNGPNIIAATTYHNLTLSPVLTAEVGNILYPAAGSITVGGNLDINPSGTANSLTFRLAADSLSVTGSTTIRGADSATSDLNTNNQDLTSSSVDIQASGTLTPGSSTVTLTGTGDVFTVTGTFTKGTSTITYNGSGSQNITATEYYNLTSSSTGDRVLASSGTISIASAFTPGTNSYTVTGSTIDFNGTSAQTIPVFTYNNLQARPTAEDITDTFAAGTIAVQGNFTVGNGVNAATTTAGTNSTILDITGSSTISASATLVAHATNDFTVAGNWINSGTFTDNGGTVTLDGTDQSLTGDTTFFNLTKQEDSDDATDSILTVASDSTQTITNVLDLDGLNADDRLNLVSDSPTTRYTFDVSSSTQTTTWLDVTDSNASSNDIQCTNCVNGGNNDDGDASPHWVFMVDVSITYELSSLTLNLGSVNPVAVSSSTQTTTVTTNATYGYVLYIAEDGDLRDSGGHAIDDVSDGEVTAGSEEYGLNTGYGEFASDTAITGSFKKLRETNSAVTDEETTLTYRAAVSATTIAGYYSHIVTIIVTGKF